MISAIVSQWACPPLPILHLLWTRRSSGNASGPDRFASRRGLWSTGADQQCGPAQKKAGKPSPMAWVCSRAFSSRSLTQIMLLKFCCCAKQFAVGVSMINSAPMSMHRLEFRGLELAPQFWVMMVGFLRPLSGAELSDGTLRFLLWLAALLTPRPPSMMVLNEPETSLHPDLLPALARLITKAADTTQVWVVTHSPALMSALGASPETRVIELEKEFGQTQVRGQNLLDR